MTHLKALRGRSAVLSRKAVPSPVSFSFHGSLTRAVRRHEEAEQMQMREEMHCESGEAERRRVRKGEGLAGCSCQTKTSAGEVENVDQSGKVQRAEMVDDLQAEVKAQRKTKKVQRYNRS